MSESLTKDGAWLGVLLMFLAGMFFTLMASDIFLSAGFNVSFVGRVILEFIAAGIVWFSFEFLLLSGNSWEWQVRLSVLGALVLLPGIFLFLVAQAIT